MGVSSFSAIPGTGVVPGKADIRMWNSSTSTALLEGLANPANEPIWREFDGRFRPVIFGFARRLGLNEEDAADVAQETLTQFLRDYRAQKYDRGRGRLHAWIMGIAAHRAADVRRARFGRRENRGESAFGEISDGEHLTVLWERECREAILERALRELRENTRVDPKTIEAFERIAFREQSPADVAAALGMSLDSVYAAKNRCLTQLRSIISRLDDAYEVG